MQSSRRARRRTARELERAAARRADPRGRRTAAAAAPQAMHGEAFAMLVRRGLRPRLGAPDLPFPPALGEDALAALAERLDHYAFRLFLRGAILAGGPFRPADATRYLSAAQARRMADLLATLGLAAPAGRGRLRLLHPARSFGGTLEWWVARELARRLGFDAIAGVKSGARGVGGDLDVVAAAEGKLVYVELKSSPPKHVARGEVRAFVRRARGLRADVTVFAVDTALRLSDKVLPMVCAELPYPAPPRRISRENWEIAPHVYAVNARQDLIENLTVVIADGLLSLGPTLS
jgi:hypothetical protein